MTEFIVSNWIELGVAITESSPGDSIKIIKGIYPTIPIKEDININFPEDYSVKVGFLPLPIDQSDVHKCGSINFNNTTINNIYQDSTAIKGYYVYIKEIPFEIHIQEPISFIHPNGAMITALRNNKDHAHFSPQDFGADKNLPKGIVEIKIPFSEEIEIDSYANFEINNIKENMNQQKYSRTIEAFENKEPAPLCNLNDFQYRALWALNSFIAIYGGLTNKQKKLSGYSTSEFRDGVLFAKYNNIKNAEPKWLNYIDHYSSSHEVEPQTIQQKLFSKTTFSLKNYIEEYMHKLNYAQATILMGQFIEEISRGDNKEKYKKIASSELSDIQKQHLLETIIARNSLLHRGVLSVNKKIDAYKVAKKEYPNLIELTEFEIFALKRPWYWFDTFQKFCSLNAKSI